MAGSCTPQLRRSRAALVGTVLLACACNFAVAGVDATRDTSDAGSAAPADLAVRSDLATSADLSTATPDLRPLPENVGDACAGSCGAGLTCMSWVPAGYCSQSCDGNSNLCPAGSTCVDIGSGASYCLVSSDGSCTRPDLRCRDCGSNVCAPSSLCGGGC